MAEDVAQGVERGEGQAVGLGERGDAEAVDVNHAATKPEGFEASERDAVLGRVPEGAVELHLDGDFGVEVIAAPVPGGGADERTGVFVGEGVVAVRAVTEGLDRGLGARDGLGRWDEEVQVVLDARLRVDAEAGFVGEAFEQDEIDVVGGEEGGDFGVGFVEVAAADGVTGLAGFDF